MLTQSEKSIKTEKRVEVIQRFLSVNAGKIEEMRKGKVEIHFSGRSITATITEYNEKLDLLRKSQ